MPFQPSLMFASEAGNIRFGRKGLPGTNTKGINTKGINTKDHTIKFFTDLPNLLALIQ
jgi:hypothetical protein